MTDIDFDELDRAVNSLMRPKPTTSSEQELNNPQQPAVEAAPVSAETATTPTASPDFNLSPVQPTELSTSTADVEPQQQTTAPKVVVKPRGQFMDVMHTSSDMKQSTVAPKLAPRRTSATLQPSGDRVTAEPAKAAVKPETTPVRESSQPPAEPAWPDPIEAATPTQVDQSPSSSIDTEPLSSPFLADAKVDKRPLGGLQPTVDLPVEPVADPDITAPQPDDSVDSTVLPEELRQDVLAVEADAAQAAKSPLQSPVAPTVATAPTTTSAPVATPTAASVGSLPQSPPPQAANSYDGEPGSSIFDTEHYQAPIKHPVKRKSSLFIVLAIIVLVVLGTGGGIAFYLLSNGY